MTAPAIKAIETEYRGHRFRSRLEARWAVFFDALDVRWEYEQQGFDLGNGVNYLPDFFLPDVGGPKGLYVEVKGVLDAAGADKVLRMAASDRQIAILGDIPAVGVTGPDFHLLDGYEPVRLPGSVWIGTAWFVAGSRVGEYVGGVYPIPCGRGQVVYDVSDPNVARTLADQVRMRDLSRNSGHIQPQALTAWAFDVARKARFEHGESGGARVFARTASRI